ncbi:COX8 domain-containing protein [Synchiropus splendidus]|uniref:COX8 domain-containing protein n=1 Tax=Synchiropus splendidus TaxID=270530 RepID=UPI00237E5042|nr:COX8 domain-containing protein [Synchiropus splendidus]
MSRLLTRIAARRTLQLKSSMKIHSKPPKDKIGAGQSFLVMSVFAVALLAPAAWILHHLPEYRQRSSRPPRQ